MKNFKFKKLVFCFFILLSTLSIFFIGSSVQLETITSKASGYTIKPSSSTVDNKTNVEQRTNEECGNIPFSLFVSTPLGNNAYSITDYLFDSESWKIQTENSNSKTIYHYELKDESTPYILLSSASEVDDYDLTTLYNSTVFFKFNDPDLKKPKENTIPNSAGYMSIEANVGKETIVVERDTSTNATTDDSFVLFKVNLQDLTSSTVECPYINESDFLGGNLDNDPSFRTGLYNLKIRYSYKDNVANISNECVFKISFYIIDYISYIPEYNDSPFLFTNTNTFYIEDESGDYVDSNYEVYNYNYKESPIVEIDADKFGLNFTYTTGYVNYSFKYKDFIPAYTQTQILNIPEEARENLNTGKLDLILELKDKTLTYKIDTFYYDQDSFYKAKFDLSDFQAFLKENKINTTFQGTYSFDLDLLVKNDISYSIVNKDLLAYVPRKITDQKLVLFGYELMYYDQNPNSETKYEDVPLKNDVTHNNFISFNDTSRYNVFSLENEGILYDIPEYIPITDQAPLRFHSFGNLGNSSSYTTPFLMYDYNTENIEATILDLFSLEGIDENDNDITKFETLLFSLEDLFYNNINAIDYHQGASISGDGIRVMQLQYSLSLPVKIFDEETQSVVSIDNKTITGCQYIVFEINNTVQNLYIQGYDGESDTSYDFNYYTNKNVKVSIEQKPNTFFAPVTVNYSYSPTYKYSEITTKSMLSLKTDSNKNVLKYSLEDTVYSYFVTDNKNDYTFKDSGYYRITIRNSISNVPRAYSFIIDKTDFSNIRVNEASLNINGSSYVKSSNLISTTLLSNPNDYINYNLYITNKAFTIGWKEKEDSGAKSFAKVYYMEITDDNENSDSSLFKNNGEYWLTNGLKFGNLSSDFKYDNSYNVDPNSNDSTLKDTQYFNKDGLYYFYIYDEAGNYFTRIVLIDSSLSSTLQGYWEGNEENSKWINTYDPNNNPANYIDEDTILYFGTHKAIKLPNLDEEINISFEDKSFTRAYKYNNEDSQYKLLTEKPPISFEFYNDVLEQLTSYVKTTSKNAIIGSATKGSFLTLPNNQLNYVKEPTAININTEEIIGTTSKGTISEIYIAKIYVKNDISSYNFNGEADYIFSIQNCNSEISTRQISMNFDVIQGTFFAYGNNENEDNSDHYIKKNSGTNLNNLKFEYNIIKDKKAKFYKLAALTYTYYPFELNYTGVNSSITSYPFAKEAEKINKDLLSSQFQNKEKTKYIIDPININLNGVTSPGKYVLTRTYVGGTHNFINGEFIEVGTGGTHYYDEENDTYENLFEYDTITRKYIVYVDHNGIITTSYMINTANPIREVGDNISLTLSKSYDEKNPYDDEWEFKEFFLTSTATLALDTNKVPVKINIPLSKYFAFYNSIQDNLYSKLSFASLEIVITYNKNAYTEVIKYEIDGYDNSTGMCTCSKLVSDKNPKGYLIFSSQGEYTITINDRTGYSDTSVNTLNADNLFPTKYSYSFKITHSSPTANMYTETYIKEKNEFVTANLTNEDSSNNFATNIKEKNEDPNSDNEVLISWDDPYTPYKAKVNQIYIHISGKDNQDNNVNEFISINLDNYNLYDLANSSDKKLTLPTNSPYKEVFDNYIKYFYIDFYKQLNQSSKFDNKDYYRYSYTISLNIASEYIYDITLSYISETSVNQSYVDDKGNSFAETLYNLRIDRTKPFTNIDNFLANEEYLKQYYGTNGTIDTNINNFKEENFDTSLLTTCPSAFTYTFGIKNDFKMTYNPQDTAPYFYIRQYENYEGEHISITPDMINTVYDEEKSYYTNLELFSLEYPRFAEVKDNSTDLITIGNNVWYKINYNTNETLYNQISKATNNSHPSGFYEIIEKDTAGNYRNYTVYLSEYSNNYFILNIDGYEFPDNRPHLISNNINTDNIAIRKSFTITELSSRLGWGSLVVRNETTQNEFEKVIRFTPFNSPTTILEELNEFFKCETDTKFSLTLSKYNSAFSSVARYLNIKISETSLLPPPTIVEVFNASTNTVSYTLKFPTYSNKSVVYLEELIINKLENNQTKNILNKKRDNDGNGIPSEVNNLQKGIYEVIYKDNFEPNPYPPYILYVGEYYINDFDKEYTFEHNKYIKYSTNENNSNNAYVISGGDVSVTYEANIYKVSVNGITVSGNNSYESLSPTLGEYNCKTFTLSSDFSYDNIPAYKSVGGITYYQVIYYDITTNKEQKRLTFTIYDYLPEINLTNAFGGDVASTLVESSLQMTNSIVYINWNDINLDINNLPENLSTPKDTVAILYTRNQNGSYKNGVQILKGQKVTEEGYYKLQIKNTSLDNYREIYFVISTGDLPLYSVGVNNKLINPSSIEKLDLTEAGGETSLLETLISTITNTNLSHNFNLNDKEKTSLLKHLDKNNKGICNLTNIPHYYSIYNTDITYNTNIDLNVIEFHFKNNTLNKAYKVGFNESSPVPANVGTDYWTTIYLVYNLDGPIRIEFFAVTKVPKTTSLIGNIINYQNERSETNTLANIDLSRNITNFTLTNSMIKDDDISLYWLPTSSNNNYWYNQGNNIYISDKYGVSNSYDDVEFEIVNNSLTQGNTYLMSKLKGAGNHNIMFKDLAGNTHIFASNTYNPQEYYTILLINSVIYHINYTELDYNPINYGVFNDSLKLVIDEEFLNYYSSLNINVTKNGSSYKGYTNEKNVYTFNESGRYVVQISALFAEDKTSLNKVTYNFTIIDSYSARLAYEFVGIPGYEITKVIRNNKDITSEFDRVNNKINSIFISSSSSTTGNGLYEVTLKYGKKETDTLTFNFIINNYVPTISCNVAHGETTKGDIKISYNPSIIYEQLGECYIKILTYNNDSRSFYNYATFAINENSFTDTSAKTITITQSSSYFVQIVTKSGNTISSFRVNKTDPLNIIAIIILVVLAIVITIIIIVILKLRNRMKIR